MDTQLKECSTCQHHCGKKSIDDVPSECYLCVHQYSRIGFYPNWKAITDNVNSPKHYTQGGIETIDYIKAKLGEEGCINYCMGNVMKYTSRWQDKNGFEDLAKARWYLNYAINLMDK